MTSRLVSQHKRNRCPVSIAKRWQLASCHHLLPIACQSDAPWGSKETEANQTCDWLWCCGWEIMDHLHNNSDLVPSDLHVFGCLKKHLVGRRFAADASVKLSSPDYSHLTPVSSMLGYKYQCHCGTDADMSLLTKWWSDVCFACIKVSIKYYTTVCSFNYLLKLFSYYYGTCWQLFQREKGRDQKGSLHVYKEPTVNSKFYKQAPKT